jgi:Zn-dependent M28 family amino/carboxypeptidase
MSPSSATRQANGSPQEQNRLVVAVLVICVLGSPAQTLGQEEPEAAVEARLAAHAGYLASDELQGRGVGTEGLDRAADYIAARFAELGLNTTLLGGSPFQTFAAAGTSDGPQSRVDWAAIAAAVAGQTVDTPAKSDAPPARKPVKTSHDATPRLVEIKNVVAVLEGEGPLADEAIVIGAHYDHLGTRPDQHGKRSVFNGANDNASGVATMLEVARLLATRQDKLPRRVVLVAFSGEERGMLGSFYYVNHPPVPLNKTIAMINLDMVGRLKGNLLITAGTGTCPPLAQMLGEISKRHELILLEIPGRLTGSDHLAFYSRRIPAVHCMTTGGRSDFHQPSDDVEALDLAGMRRIAGVVAELTVALAEAEERPQFAADGWGGVVARNAVRWWGRFTSKLAEPKADSGQGPNPPSTENRGAPPTPKRKPPRQAQDP